MGTRFGGDLARRVWLLNAAVFLSAVVIFEPAANAANSCSTLFENKVRPSFSEATDRLLKYEKSISSQILEREYVLDSFLVSLIAKEHMLLVGPPGNAKTTLAKLLMSNIVDAQTGKPSFYAMQMNKEITLSDTHGSINFKVLSDEGAVRRNYHEGLLGAKFGFIDEAFDIRPGAFRNILDVLAERSHSQGTAHFKGETEVIIAATNKTLSEVYEEFNNSEQPRALIDRFAFVFFIPKEMASIKSDRQIFSGARTTSGSSGGASNGAVSKLTFQDLDVLRELATKVEVPDYIADLAGMIHYRLTPEFESREVKAMEIYREKLQNGEHTLPSFRSAKYMSPRTLAKAGSVLRSIVVLDYARRGGKRSLIATIDDLSKLRSFYQLNGPSQKVLEAQLNRAVKEYEKDQIKSVQTERDIVNPLFDSVVKEFRHELAGSDLGHVRGLVSKYPTASPEERRKTANIIKMMYLNALDDSRKTSKVDLTVEEIASYAVVDFVREFAVRIWKDKAPAVIASWKDEPSRREKRRERQRALRTSSSLEPSQGSLASSPGRSEDWSPPPPATDIHTPGVVSLTMSSRPAIEIAGTSAEALTFSGDNSVLARQADHRLNLKKTDFENQTTSDVTWAGRFADVVPLGDKDFLGYALKTNMAKGVFNINQTSLLGFSDIRSLVRQSSGDVIAFTSQTVVRINSNFGQTSLVTLSDPKTTIRTGAVDLMDHSSVIYLASSATGVFKFCRQSMTSSEVFDKDAPEHMQQELKNHFATADTMGFSPKMFVVGSLGVIRFSDENMFFEIGGRRRWHVDSTEPTSTFDISPDGKMVAVSYRNDIEIYDVATWLALNLGEDVGISSLASYSGKNKPTSLRFSPDGTQLAVATADEVQILDVTRGQK